LVETPGIKNPYSRLLIRPYYTV